MRLYTLNKRQFVLVFVTFFVCFGISILIGLAGKCKSEQRIRINKIIEAHCIVYTICSHYSWDLRYPDVTRQHNTAVYLFLAHLNLLRSLRPRAQLSSPVFYSTPMAGIEGGDHGVMDLVM